jgi:hypothetical protein
MKVVRDACTLLAVLARSLQSRNARDPFVDSVFYPTMSIFPDQRRYLCIADALGKIDTTYLLALDGHRSNLSLLDAGASFA